MKYRAKAFTLIELMVSVTIVTLLIGLLLSAVGAAQRNGQRATCLSNLHQAGLATSMYLAEYKGQFWRYFSTIPDGRLWWFGYEPNGPGHGTGRSLDTNRGVLSAYLQAAGGELQCPTFPYDDPQFYAKFDRRAASYGYNLKLGSASQSRDPRHLDHFMGRAHRVVVFADAIHFDHNPGFNEGHYITINPNVRVRSGYAHFRHDLMAHVLMVDGHVESQTHQGQYHREIAGGLAANLRSPDGSDAIYGN
ncbi:MAG: hypothetical protein CMJ20_08650 [Phycisphaeraceae bacterium]|nr:hypothetical protein [Phycisphaeraceae bacterium]